MKYLEGNLMIQNPDLKSSKALINNSESKSDREIIISLPVNLPSQTSFLTSNFSVLGLFVKMSGAFVLGSLVLGISLKPKNNDKEYLEKIQGLGPDYDAIWEELEQEEKARIEAMIQESKAKTEVLREDFKAKNEGLEERLIQNVQLEYIAFKTSCNRKLLKLPRNETVVAFYYQKTDNSIIKDRIQSEKIQARVIELGDLLNKVENKLRLDNLDLKPGQFAKIQKIYQTLEQITAEIELYQSALKCVEKLIDYIGSTHRLAILAKSNNRSCSQLQELIERFWDDARAVPPLRWLKSWENLKNEVTKNLTEIEELNQLYRHSVLELPFPSSAKTPEVLLNLKVEHKTINNNLAKLKEETNMRIKATIQMVKKDCYAFMESNTIFETYKAMVSDVSDIQKESETQNCKVSTKYKMLIVKMNEYGRHLEKLLLALKKTPIKEMPTEITDKNVNTTVGTPFEYIYTILLAIIPKTQYGAPLFLIDRAFTKLFLELNDLAKANKHSTLYTYSKNAALLNPCDEWQIELDQLLSEIEIDREWSEKMIAKYVENDLAFDQLLWVKSRNLQLKQITEKLKERKLILETISAGITSLKNLSLPF